LGELSGEATPPLVGPVLLLLLLLPLRMAAVVVVVSHCSKTSMGLTCDAEVCVEKGRAL